MSKFMFKIGEQIFQIENLNELMNSQFLGLYESHFSGRGFDLTKFKEEALRFFDQNDNNYSAHDGFFNNFTIIWQYFLNHGRFKSAENLWSFALEIAYEWGKKHQSKRIHKGTPYYFWGVTCILNGDLEKGFLLMHQALEEDKTSHQTNTPKTPAYSFVTLDYEKQDQFFRPKVIEIARFIDEKLEAYRLSRCGTLTLQDFKLKFLESTLHEVVFHFVFTTFRLKKLLTEVEQRLTQNIFSSLLQTDVIFDICLIVDNILKQKNPSRWKFFEHLKFLSSRSSLNLNEQRLKELGNAFKTDFSNTLQKLLSSQYHYQDGTAPSHVEEDLAITYGFRNFGAHKIENQPVIYQNFNEITQRILNALCFSIEKLYV